MDMRFEQLEMGPTVPPEWKHLLASEAQGAATSLVCPRRAVDKFAVHPRHLELSHAGNAALVTEKNIFVDLQIIKEPTQQFALLNPSSASQKHLLPTLSQSLFWSLGSTDSWSKRNAQSDSQHLPTSPKSQSTNPKSPMSLSIIFNPQNPSDPKLCPWNDQGCYTEIKEQFSEELTWEKSPGATVPPAKIWSVSVYISNVWIQPEEELYIVYSSQMLILRFSHKLSEEVIAGSWPRRSIGFWNRCGVTTAKYQNIDICSRCEEIF